MKKKKITCGVGIIECLDKDDPGSEGRCLEHVFNLMEIDSAYSHVDSIDDLLRSIAESEFQYVHISAHGATGGKQDRFKGWWTPKGIGTKAKVAQLIGNVKATAIISTACKSGTQGFGRYIVNELGCQYFIGPTGSPKFYNASLFAHIFYHKLFRSKGGVPSAFRSYENINISNNPHHFTLYDRSTKYK